jgi:hypothetical protein
MPTIGYAQAELYYESIEKKLSKSSPEILQSVISNFENKPLYKRFLHRAFPTRTLLDYMAAKNIRKS